LSCELDIDECRAGACVNGGTCVDGINSYSCSCRAGYTGTNCATDINECSSSPCVNGATCNDEINSFSCSCPEGYTGQTCSVRRGKKVLFIRLFRYVHLGFVSMEKAKTPKYCPYCRCLFLVS